MWRKIEINLQKWINNENSLPLFLFGARQVGKTYIVKKIANQYFQNKYIYINFFDRDRYFELLKDKTKPSEIIEIINFVSGKKINDEYLLIFDEIQEMPNIKTSLKLFVEQNYKIKIICLGSYLGNSLNKDNWSIPVGKVERMNLYPLNFEEFLMATSNKQYINIIKQSLINKKRINDTTHKILLELVHDFMIIGGMPSVVNDYINNKDLNKVEELKSNLLKDYKEDIGKYIQNNKDKLKAISIFENINAFLSKQNKKFKLSQLDSNARYLNYESAIKNLELTKIIYKINNLNNVSTLLMNNFKESEFKIYYNDCGFLINSLKLNKYILFSESNELYANIKGSLVENYVISEFWSKTNGNNLYYYSFRGNENNSGNKNYSRNNSNTNYEIDLCTEDNKGNFIPIEIKFGTKFSKKSLKKIIIDNKPKFSIVISSKNFSLDKNTNIYNIPIYASTFIEFQNDRLVSFID